MTANMELCGEHGGHGVYHYRRADELLQRVGLQEACLDLIKNAKYAKRTKTLFCTSPGV